jgi:hypothetical protein
MRSAGARCGAGVAIGAIMLLLAACHGFAPPAATPAADVRLLAESTAPGAQVWILPQSGVRISCAVEPAVATDDIASVDTVTLELGKALLVQLNPAGVGKLTAREAALGGRRLVLVVNGAALGAVRLNQPVTGGRLVLFVELSEAELSNLTRTLGPALRRRHRAASSRS